MAAPESCTTRLLVPRTLFTREEIRRVRLRPPRKRDLEQVFATPLLISCTPHFWIRKWRVGKEGLARVFAVRIQGSRTHFSNLAVPAPLRSIWWSIQGSQMTTTLCYGYAFVRASVSDASTCPSLNTTAHRFRRDHLRLDGLAASLRSRVGILCGDFRDAVRGHRGSRVRAQLLLRRKTRFAEFFRRGTYH